MTLDQRDTGNKTARRAIRIFVGLSAVFAVVVAATTPQPGSTFKIPAAPLPPSIPVPSTPDISSPAYNWCQADLHTCSAAITECQATSATTVAVTGTVTNRDAVAENYSIPIAMTGGPISTAVGNATAWSVEPGQTVAWNSAANVPPGEQFTSNPTCTIQEVVSEAS